MTEKVQIDGLAFRDAEDPDICNLIVRDAGDGIAIEFPRTEVGVALDAKDTEGLFRWLAKWHNRPSVVDRCVAKDKNGTQCHLIGHAPELAHVFHPVPL